MNNTAFETPLVSVIVPVYNAALYLDDCIQSLVRQTYPNIEIVLVDDGSTDQSGSMCDAYGNDHGNIRVIHQNNQGQSAARNHALKIAKAEWIMYVDSDDAIHPRTIELLMRMIQECHVRMATSKNLRIKELPEQYSEITEFSYEHAHFCEEHLVSEQYDCWCVWARIIHRSIVEKYPFEEGRIYEDNAVILDWLYEAGEIAYTDEPLYYYRYNDTGTTGSWFSPKKLDLLWAFEQRLAFYQRHSFKTMLRKALIHYIHNSGDLIIRVQKELKDKALGRQTRRKTIQVVRQYSKNIKHPIGAYLRLVKYLVRTI